MEELLFTVSGRGRELSGGASIHFVEDGRGRELSGGASIHCVGEEGVGN